MPSGFVSAESVRGAEAAGAALAPDEGDRSERAHRGRRGQPERELPGRPRALDRFDRRRGNRLVDDLAGERPLRAPGARRRSTAAARAASCAGSAAPARGSRAASPPAAARSPAPPGAPRRARARPSRPRTAAAPRASRRARRRTTRCRPAGRPRRPPPAPAPCRPRCRGSPPARVAPIVSVGDFASCDADRRPRPSPVGSIALASPKSRTLTFPSMEALMF